MDNLFGIVLNIWKIQMDKKEYISFFNKNIIFDKTIGKFEGVDLFSFLENLSTFDYEDVYDDTYYILKYTNDAILHIISNTKQEIRRGYELTHISKAKEFDKETDLYIAKKPGISLRDKLQDGKIKAVKRYESFDTYENRLFKKFLKKIVNILENNEFNAHLYIKIRKFLRSEEAKEINENKKIVFNNILLHHKFYKKIFKAYKWLNLLEEKNKSIQVNKKVLFYLEVLKQLQYFSDIPIFPDILDIDLDKKFINIKNNLSDFDINKIYTNDFRLNNLQEVVRNILLEQKIELNKDYRFDKKFREKEVYIDIFRAYPVCLVDDEFIQMPLFLKQKINNKIVNANNTKIIDLDKEFYTLPEILKSYDIDIFRYFIQDLEKYFQNSHINYIMPDYINLFEFSKIKKIFNTYFKTKAIPKSIVASLEFLFSNRVKKNDTLIYIQKNYNDELFITPILVKKDETKKTLNGLYLEKYPTKKFKDDKSILQGLKEYFDEDMANLLLSKFLQNGLKQIFTIKKKSKIKIVKKVSKANQPVSFLYKNKIIEPQNVELEEFHYNKDEIKSIYGYPQLFTNDIKIVNDSNKTNLINFQKLLKYEKDGFVLWKEHLIKLAMGNIFRDGYFDEFVLVDDNSEVLGNEIIIKNYFLLPANQKEVSFPLILGEDSINYEAYITSEEMPFEKDIKCKLQLTYDFEAENPYELIFTPLDNNYKPIKVKWREIEYRNDLKYPQYPKKKTIDELENFEGNNTTTDLIKWMKDSFKYIIQLEDNLNNIEEEASLSKFWINDQYQEIDTSKGLVRIYKNKNLEKANKIYFRLERKGRYYKIKSIITNIEHLNLMKRVRFPVYNIFKDEFDISNLDCDFLDLYEQAINSASQIIKNSDNKNLSKEILYFLSCIQNQKAINTLIEKFDIDLNTYRDNIAYSLGCIKLQNQQILFQKILQKLNSNKEKEYSNILKILGISLYRCESLIYKLNNTEVDLILNKLLKSLKLKIKSSKELIRNEKIKPSVVIRFELLLAIIRLREKKSDLLHPKDDITKQFISIIDKITKKIITKRLEFKSRVEIELDKPKEFEKTPTLLYALRLYLTADTKANNIKILGVSDE